ncbi:MAG: hypothetical protein KGM17_03135 [Sphingomonadales bacterium]|nr:hypothetical protein [Sphingomonadales bacterium]
MPPGFVTGDATGLAIPADAAGLRAAGPEWLTRAGRAFGALAPDNAVVAMRDFAAVAEGNSGHKARFAVDYARDDGLPRTLFVKFSRDFGDAFRDRRRFELEPEIRLATLSRHPAFPVAVPRAFFGDFARASGTGLLITEAIAFGQGAIEPLRAKCMDHELADPLPYYQALLEAQGRLAGTFLSGRLSPQAERLFPFDRATAEADLPIAQDADGVRAAVARLRDFARECPALLPRTVGSEGFLGRFERDALGFVAHQREIRRFLYADRELVGLAHWNTHIDNAWFWRDVGGLRCGLLDWGMVRQMNLAIPVWGCISGAPHELLLSRLDALLAGYAAAIAAAGGPTIAMDRLETHLAGAVMLMMLSMMLDLAALIRARVPDVALARGPLDPILRRDPVATGFLHVATGALLLWEARDFGARLQRLV